MLICEGPCFERRSPDFSISDLSNPIWIYVKCGGVQLCNSLEWAEWKTNPVQVQICEQCGTSGCASTGYVHISVLNDAVLWTWPQRSSALDIADLTSGSSVVIRRFGSAMFSGDAWTALRNIAPEVPVPDALPPATGQVMRDAWAVSPNRPDSDEELMAWLGDRLLAADSLDVDQALAAVAQWLRWFQDRASSTVRGIVARAENAGSQMERLYFDGPASEDWTAFAWYSGSLARALAADRVFLPDSRNP